MDPERNAGTPYLLAPLLVVAAAMRIAVHNVAVWSRADETVYLLYAQALSGGGGYPKLVRMYLDDPGMSLFPHPLRWSWIGVTSLFCSASGDCTYRSLATVSTFAGIVVIALAYWIGRELFGTTEGLIGAALVATSPLQLALGRRALVDEFFCAAVLASVAALLLYLRARDLRWLAAWVAATTIALGAKEQFLFLYPAILLFWWLHTRRLDWREIVAWMLPPLLYAAVFSILARDLTSFLQITRVTTSTIGAPYAEQFQSGPPHRLLLDLLSLAPLATMLAVAVVISIAFRGAAFPPEARRLAVLAAGFVVVHALVPSQNVRYVATADALLRVLVAAFLWRELRDRKWAAPALAAGLLINALVEAKLFYTVFIAAQVYDPVTDNVLRALRMLPR